MKTLLLVGFAVAAVAVGLGKDRTVTEAELRAASTNAIRRMQPSQATWYKVASCTSCHHQLVPEVTLALARERGVPVDETIARGNTSQALAFMKDLDRAVQGYYYIDPFYDGWTLVAAEAAGVAPNAATDVTAEALASRQFADGSWFSTDCRPPQAYGRFAATAVCARALELYLPEPLAAERTARVARAREWLVTSAPRTTEDRAYRLLGLAWTGTGSDVRQQAARQLLAEQREDGGWAALPGRESDAYSTGEALVALAEGARLAAADPAYQRGLRFLLRTQQSDGSWHVVSRLHPPAPVSPPYVESGFPYGHDQFISMMGTSWATAAMLRALPMRSPKRAAPPDAAPAERDAWIRTALAGSAEDLRKLLDAGLSPNAKTAGGTTALMMAARDVEKVRLLVDRGADVNARAATGFTPLMVAARYSGNAEVVRLLLERGARPNPDEGVAVTYDASALYLAVMAQDVEMVRALVDAGARLDRRMKVLGMIPISPAVFATVAGDAQTVEYLLGRGTSANELDPDEISLLAWAAIENRPDVVRVLLAHGADVNHVDSYGMTPLLYAASIDFGETAVVEQLVAAGADLTVKTREGLTALELARRYRHEPTARVLAARSSR
jgi:ankyrin repeat protein